MREALVASQGFGFLGPGPLETAFEHAICFVDVGGSLLPNAPQAVWMDLGSGGGVPGLVCLEALPESRWVLLDGQTKRVAFLQDVVQAWGVQERVLTILGRAELVCREPYVPTIDVVVARGFGPPALTAECAAGFLRVGGLLIVSEPPDSTGERWADLAGTQLGMTFEGIHRSRGFGYAVIRQSSAPNPMYPRSSTALKKRPLF